MTILSRQVLSDTGTEWNKLSEPVKAAGWYGRTAGMHTIAFTLRNFVGRIYILATLENSPEEADANNSWFTIQMVGTCYQWIEFPTARDKDKPTLPVSMHGFQTTGTFCETFVGNFTYIKVGMDRDALTTTPQTADHTAVGKLESVMLNF